MEIYKYDPVTGNEYYCGIKVISQDEQLDYILAAAESCPRDKKVAALHMENYNKYEVRAGEIVHGKRTEIERTKPKGYCKTCRPGHGIRRSLSPFTSYNCAHCLARYLVELRANSPGITITCRILSQDGKDGKDGKDGRDIAKYRSVSVKLTKGVCELNLDGTIVRIGSFVLRAGNDDNAPTLEIKSITKPVMYFGMCTASLIGIPICESLFYGRECFSSAPPSSPTYGKVFNTLCVPRSYPGWDEMSDDLHITVKDKTYKGKLWVHLQCKGCRDARPIEHKLEPIHDLEKKEEKKEEKEEKEEKEDVGDLRDEMIRKLLEEKADQLDEIRKLRAAVVDLQLRLAEKTQNDDE
jgi:hypothetical protein